jgi:type IV pilus assembly protein PilB
VPRDIDDILSELGLAGSGKTEKKGGNAVDGAEAPLAPIPAVPSGQAAFGDEKPSVEADPAVKTAPAAAPKANVGEAVSGVYAPEAGLILRAEAENDLGKMLVQRGVATGEAIAAAKKVVQQSPGRTLASVLIEQGLPAHEVQAVVAELVGVSFERIDLEKGLEGGIDGVMFQRLGLEFCKERGVIPLRMQGSRLVVGTTRPDNVFVMDELRSRLGVPAKPVLVTEDDLRASLELLGDKGDEDADLTDILADVDEGDVEFATQSESATALDLEAQAGESPVIRYVNYIIQTAVKEGASDIHIEPGETKLKVRFRIDGILFEMMNPPPGMSAAIASRLKIMANLDISERRVPQDGRIRASVGGRKLDLRMSTLPTGYGEKIVMRILDQKSIQVELDNLGFDPETLHVWKSAIDEPHGIVLVTGPTGSGKTTTLYASLRTLDRNKMNISTVEDPIEYHLDGITQTQMHEKIGMTFAKALKALLRQDPDVIMLGEIRDHETAHTAVQAALTGHLVLSTLHTNDAPSSVTRLVNIGLEPFLVGAAVNAVLAQRLVRRLCSQCRAEKPPTEEMAEFLQIQGMATDKMWMPSGCEKCRSTGYSGRVGIYELLAVDDSLRDVIARNPNVSEFKRLCMERGMTTLRTDGLRKASEGRTSVSEVLRVTESSS